MSGNCFKYMILVKGHKVKEIRALIIILYVLMLSGPLLAQNRNFRFQYLTADQGLSQNFVDCILKDSFGFMWFGTRNGLNRFDGYRFTVYKNDIQNQKSISNNLVRTLCEDAYGNIWIGTNKSVDIYLYEKDRFISLSNDTSVNQVLANVIINCIISDQKGDIWIGTDKGLFILNGILPNGGFSKMTYLQHSESAGSISNNLINYLYEDHKGRMWIGTNQGLDLFNENDGVLKSFRYDQNNNSTLSNNEILSILYDRNDNLWVGTTIGLNRLVPETGVNERYYHIPNQGSSLAHNTVKCITVDNTGKVIVGTLGGVSIYNFESNNFANYTHEINSYNCINNDFINSVFADQEGNIWIGTERGGINRYNIYQNEFEYFEYKAGNNQSLSHNTVNSVLEDKKNIWIGTAGGGLNKIDKTTGRYTHYKNNPLDPTSINNDFITSIYRDKNGNIWLGTWGNGINLLSSERIKTGIFDHYFQIQGNPNSLINDYVSTITSDKKGNLWIGTFGGLNKFDPVSQSFIHIDGNLPENQVSKVGCLHFDKNENLWIGTEQGLYKIYNPDSMHTHPEKYKIRKYTKSSVLNGSISGNYVISIFEDSKGSLWFGTYGDGLNKLVHDSLDGPDSFIYYTENDGLANNIVYGIQEDKNENLWLSTDNGLSRFNPKSGEFRNYYISDGLQSNQFYWSSHFTNEEGKMYFGNMKGLIAFFPEKIADRNIEDNLVITNFQVFNQSVEIGKKYYDELLLNTSVVKVDKINLSYKVKEFSFEFAVLDFDQTEKIQYRYKMQNFDKEWNYVGYERRFVSYTNLKGGDYTFIVQAALDNKMWGNSNLKIQIHIIPPFWVRWWFVLIVGLISLSSVVAYNRYRTYALKQRKKVLELQVKERTAQIEGQNQQLELQNIEILEQRDKLMDMNKKVQLANQEQMRFFIHLSHEFRTPLTLIISPIDQVISKLDEKTDFSKKLLIAKKNANRLLHLVNQLLEIRRIKTGRYELKANKVDIVKFLENISQSFSNLSAQQNIKYSFIPGQNTLFTYTDKEKLESIFYNVVSNAIKYTPEGGSISVRVSLVSEYPDKHSHEDEIAIVKQKNEWNGKLIELIISDTGIGIEKEYLKDIFRRFYRVSIENINIPGTGIGLYITKELVKALRGWLFVRSSPGKGSEFKFLFPYGKDYLSDNEIDEKTTDNVESDEKMHLTTLSELIETRKKAGNIVPDNSKNNIYKSLVLLVDDDSDLCEYISDYISRDFNVLIAKNGIEGLEKARLFLPDIIISDYVMPKMDGLEFCSLLKSDIQISHIPFILLSARTEVEVIIDGFETGADDYLQKPFELLILEAKIKSVIENRLRLKKLFSSSLIPDLKKITSNTVDNKFLKQAVEIIESKMANSDFGVPDLALELCVSRSLLHKKLSSLVGQSAFDFIISLRLKRAAQLIIEGSLKISEIAYQVGFNDPKYFTRCFKKHFEKTPSQYLHEVK